MDVTDFRDFRLLNELYQSIPTNNLATKGTIFKMYKLNTLKSQQQIATSVDGHFLNHKGQTLDQDIHFITFQQRNSCKFGLCMLTKILNIQNCVLLWGIIWTAEHIEYINACKVILIYVWCLSIWHCGVQLFPNVINAVDCNYLQMKWMHWDIVICISNEHSRLHFTYVQLLIFFSLHLLLSWGWEIWTTSLTCPSREILWVIENNGNSDWNEIF